MTGRSMPGTWTNSRASPWRGCWRWTGRCAAAAQPGCWRRAVLFGQFLLGHGALVEHRRTLGEGNLLGQDLQGPQLRGPWPRCAPSWRAGSWPARRSAHGPRGPARQSCRRAVLHAVVPGRSAAAGGRRRAPRQTLGLLDGTAADAGPSQVPRQAGQAGRIGTVCRGRDHGHGRGDCLFLQLLSRSWRRVGGPPPESCSSFSASSLMVRRAARSRALIWEERSAANRPARNPRGRSHPADRGGRCPVGGGQVGLLPGRGPAGARSIGLAGRLAVSRQALPRRHPWCRRPGSAQGFISGPP